MSALSVTAGVGLFPLAMQHFYSFVSHVISWLLSPRFAGHAAFFPKQFTVRGSQCFKEWSPWCWMVWPACLPLPFICLPVLFICLPGWVLVVRFPAGLSPTFICFPLLFMCLPLPFICPPTSFHLSPSSFHLFFVSQAGCLWSGSRLACLPFPFICLPLLFTCLPVLFIPGCVGFPAGLSPTSFHLSPRLGACGPVPGWLVSHFLAFVSHFLLFVSHFFSFVPAGLSPTSLICLPFPFNCFPVLVICLPKWMLVVGFPAGLSPTSLHLSPTFSPNSLLLGVLNSFLRCCPPFVSLLVSAHFHWPLVV